MCDADEKFYFSLSLICSHLYPIFSNRATKARVVVQSALLISLSFLRIDKGWVQDFVFLSCIRALKNQVTLTHRDPVLRLCVNTDVSDVAWSGILSHVLLGDLSKPHEN